PSSMTTNPNAGAFYILVGILIVWSLHNWRNSRLSVNLAHGFLLFVASWALLQTGSRAALLGLLVSVICGLLLQSHLGDKVVGSVHNLVLAGCALIVSFLLYSGHGPRWIQVLLEDQARLRESDDSIDIWRAA